MSAKVEIRTDQGVLDLEQGADNDFYITRQIYDINSFEHRQSDNTKEIEIPATPENSVALKLVTDAAVPVGHKIACSVTINGIMVAPIAWLIVSGMVTTKNGVMYRLVIFYGNFNLFDKIEGQSIADLNWADVAVEWVQAELLIKSQNTYLDNDMVYPVADWNNRQSAGFGTVRTQNQMDSNLTGFFLYVRNIVDRIISETGMSLIVDDSVPAEFNELALACAMTKFTQPELYEGSSPSTGLVVNNANQVVQDVVEVIGLFQDLTNAGPLWMSGLQAFVVDATQSYDITVYGFYSHVQVHPQASDSVIGIYQNGIPIDEFLMDSTDPQQQFRLYGRVAALIGDVIYVGLKSGNRAAQVSTITLWSGTQFSCSTVGTNVNRTIFAEDWIPQIPKGDFIKEMLKLYNLFITTDDITETVTLSAFNTIAERPEKDLSDRLSVNGEIEHNFAVKSIGQSSIFKWQNDGLLRRDTDHTINQNNNLLSREVVSLEMIFSACDDSVLYNSSAQDVNSKAKLPMVLMGEDALSGVTMTVASDGSYVLTGNLKLRVGMYVGLLSPDTSSNIEVYRVIEVTTETTGFLQTPILGTSVGDVMDVRTAYKPSPVTFMDRVAVVKTDGGEIVYQITDGSDQGFTYFVAASKTASWTQSLRMVNVTANQYSVLLDALKTPQIIEADFNISALDIAIIDLRNPIYVSHFNAHYYINKIDKFKADNITKLQLVRISKIE